MFLIYQVGQQYPHKQLLGHNSAAIADLTQESFTISFGLSNPTEVEVESFQSATIFCGLFEIENIPFLIFDFGVMGFDVSFNVKLISEKHVSSWIRNTNTTANLILVDSMTNNIISIRPSVVDPNVMTELRTILLMQDSIFDTAAQVKEAIIKIQNTHETHEMMLLAKSTCVLK